MPLEWIYAVSATSVKGFMRPSPARSVAPEPDKWIPIESLEALPELEVLLDPRFLVDSGQSRAVKLGEDGQGYVFIDPEIDAATRFEKEEKRAMSHRRWVSKRRTLRLQRKNKLLTASLFIALLSIAIAGIGSWATSNSSSNSAKKGDFVHVFMPTKVPVVIEGQPQTIFTVADNTKELLEQNQWVGLNPLDNNFDRIGFEDTAKKTPFEIRYSKIISLNVDSTTTSVLTTELDVASVLAENHIVLDIDDIVNPPRETPAKNVHAIFVTRVSTATRTATQSIPFKIEKQNDSSLAKGKSVVKRAGINGEAQVTYTQVLENGNVASETESSRVVTKNPVNQIILVGTKNPQHESGKATYYAAPGGTCAHKTLPMGTIVTVTNTSNGNSVTCRVADRGPFGPGRVIDLSKDGFAKLAPLSQGIVSVSLSW